MIYLLLLDTHTWFSNQCPPLAHSTTVTGSHCYHYAAKRHFSSATSPRINQLAQSISRPPKSLTLLPRPEWGSRERIILLVSAHLMEDKYCLPSVLHLKNYADQAFYAGHYP